MFKFISIFILSILFIDSYGHVPRLKFLFENPGNVDHDKKFFTGKLSMWKAEKTILNNLSGNLKKEMIFTFTSKMDENKFYTKMAAYNVDRELVSEKFLDNKPIELLIKGILNGFIFNSSMDVLDFLNLFGGELGSNDTNEEVSSFIKKHIEIIEEEKDKTDGDSEEEVNEEVVKEELKDVAKLEEEGADEEVSWTIEEALSKRFYLEGKAVTLDFCEFGPCFKVEIPGIEFYFDRHKLDLVRINVSYNKMLKGLDGARKQDSESLNIKGETSSETKNVTDTNEILLSQNAGYDKEKKIILHFQNYHKAAGRYNFPKQIMLEIDDNETFLFRLEEFRLRSNGKSIVIKAKESGYLDQILSI